LEIKREYGEAYPSGIKTVAAPATVNGEYRPKIATGKPGRLVDN
jgi:hypothetical protein